MRSPSPEYEDRLRQKLGQPSRSEEQAAAPHNHWNADGDLVIEQKTLFRRVGWLTHNTKQFSTDITEPRPGQLEGISPVYEQIATWVEGEGWND
jgi:hypothetical protein